MNIKQVPPHTIITAAVAVAWLGSFALRAINPEFALGPAADALMVTTVTYWLKAQAGARKDGSGLVESLVNEVALPMISTAHTPGTPAAKPVTPAQPTKSPTPPYTPPTTPPKGGLPWNS